MNDDRIEGTKHEIKGGLKEVAGKVTGDTSTEVSGNLEKNAGKVQRNVGEVEDELDDDLEE
ncbi:CsbD family protein [Fulvimonas yonginensis]|uniref:CsbD family protein n=1 Tax=Fulvimonas yonginensis TaxID=1495200 RepID=A0ABU8J7I1_9GAMM